MIRLRASLGALLFIGAASLPLLTIPLDAQQTDRAKRIGSKLLCMCNCNQILTQCNHVGCTTSASMLKELDRQVARGDSNDLIAQAFVQTYGPQVLAEPPNKGFGRVAWWIPAMALAAGLALVSLVISRWTKRPAQVAAGPAAPGVSPEFLERARHQADRDTED